MGGQLDMGVESDRLEEIWNLIDDDGNGHVSFAEFVDWATEFGIDLPVGMEAADPEAHKCMECGITDCECTSFCPTEDDDRFCKCGHKRSAHAANDDETMVSAIPCYWTNQRVEEKNNFFEWIDCDDDTVQEIQQLVDASVKRTWTRDRGKGMKVPSGYTVVAVKRSENYKLWRKYVLKRSLIKQNLERDTDLPFEAYTVKTALAGTPSFMSGEPLDESCNEWLLWHGTSLEGAERICEIDFKQRLAGTATGTLYGRGTYFAESCTKADEYAQVSQDGEHAGLFAMLLCRVVGGRVRYTDEPEPDADALTADCLHGSYDAVLGDREKCRNTFREFVLFASDQAYPEYIVFYKRRFG